MGPKRIRNLSKMKYPNYFEIESIEEIKAFLTRVPPKKKSFRSGRKEKPFFVISFKMTGQYGRMGNQYKCIGFETDWDNKKITKLRFRKTE